jgi:nicotinate-nucleotide--dimethylbenzimidazole phosphoribosyltransferase
VIHQVVEHVIESIGPASEANAQMARSRIAGVGAPMLDRLAARLAGAQHTPTPRGAQRKIVVAIGDHGCGDPGIAMGADHPTVIAARAIADGSAALCQIARGNSPESTAGTLSAGTSIVGGTPIVLVNAGARESSHMPGIAVQLGRGATHDLMREPAMTVIDAMLGLEAGIALAMSLADDGSPSGGPGEVRHALDVLALGALGVGSEVSSAAILGAATKRPVLGLSDDVAEAASVKGASLPGAQALEILATFGGSETAVMAGLILGAASINVPVILDSYATGAAAIIAAGFAPAVTGYLIAAHRGSFTMPGIIAHLGLEPIFDVGLGHGEGTGAAMVLPLVDQVAGLVRTR